jgi:hypothetical protein
MSAQEQRERLEENRRENGEAIRSAERLNGRLDEASEAAREKAERAIQGIERLSRNGTNGQS